MTSKILRSDNTAIANIKSVKFVEKVNATADLRPGCVSSAYIEVVVYGAQSSAPSSGEPLKYYQVSANGVETYIGTFYAEPSIQSRNTYSFVAFDIVDKLNVGFGERLLAIQEDFPMDLSDLVEEACDVAGVELYSTNFPLHDMPVQSFWVDGITCRDILSYAAEIACCYVQCDSNEKLRFNWYAEKEDYRIYPTSEDTLEETRIAYKQNGLSYQDYSVHTVGSVAVRPLNTEGAAYIYPSTFSSVTALDPLHNGVVTLVNLTAVDDGDGNVELSGDFTATDTNSNVEIVPEGGSSSNCLVIQNNLLLTNATDVVMETVAEWIYTQMSALPAYRPAVAHLFPFENPFRAGDIVAVTDAQNVSFMMPVMSMTVEQSAATVEATGNLSYDQDFGTDTAKQLQNLSNSIVQIDRLKVGYAEIDTAVVDSLEANGINADWINTGALTVKDANDNVIFEADQDTHTVTIAGWTADDAYLTSSRTGWIPLKLGDGQIVFNDSNIATLLIVKQLNGLYYRGNHICVGLHTPNASQFATAFSIGDTEGGNNYYYLDVDDMSGTPHGIHYLSGDVDISGDVTIGSSSTNKNLTLNGVNVKNKVNQIGNLSNLSTTAKTDLVSAINELYTMITT